MLGLDYASGYHNGDVGDLMIVNAFDINSSIEFFNDINIIISNATIGTSIYEQTHFLRFVGVDQVIDVMDLNLVIFLAIDHNFVILGRTCIRFGHELSTLCTLVHIGEVTRMGSAFLLA